MQWTSLASTALGALIALLAAMLNERFRWRREQTSDRRKLLQQTYSAYLAALTEAHEQMRAESLIDHPTPETRSAAVLDAFRRARCYALRYELAIVAEQGVLDEAERTFRILREVRDLLAREGTTDSEPYKTLRGDYAASLRNLQHRMRLELGAESVVLGGGS